jgi:hypothetical protein
MKTKVQKMRNIKTIVIAGIVLFPIAITAGVIC